MQPTTPRSRSALSPRPTVSIGRPPFEANRSRRVPAGILPEGHFMRVQGATAFALAG